MGGYFSRADAEDTTGASADQMVVPAVVAANARMPTRASGDAAGYDLSASETATLEPGDRAVVDTGVKMAIGNPSLSCKFPPSDFVIHGNIRGRSGLAKKGIDVFQGTVDADYRGSIKVILINNSDKTFQINAGDRIAQLVFLITLTPTLLSMEALEETARGEGGFGSTGTMAVKAVKEREPTRASVPDEIQIDPVAIVVEAAAPASESV